METTRHRALSGRGAPPRDTRAEILAVATELFSEQGFEATSLREIAERLGITKAALYYHFPSKDDILAALLEPMGATLAELVDRLGAATDVEQWANALSWIIDMVFENVALFRVLQRNRHAMQQLHDSFDAMQEHIGMHQRVQEAVHAAAADVGEEIRMFAALGAVTAFDDWAPHLLADGPAEVIERELRAAVRAILRIESPPRSARIRRRVRESR
jgi:AcrR family transcriptional regulator